MFHLGANRGKTIIPSGIDVVADIEQSRTTLTTSIGVEDAVRGVTVIGVWVAVEHVALD